MPLLPSPLSVLRATTDAHAGLRLVTHYSALQHVRSRSSGVSCPFHDHVLSHHSPTSFCELSPPAYNLQSLSQRALSGRGTQVLHNVPQLRDIAGMTTVLQSLGVRVYRDAAGTMLVDASQVTPPSPPLRRVQ